MMKKTGRMNIMYIPRHWKEADDETDRDFNMS